MSVIISVNPDFMLLLGPPKNNVKCEKRSDRHSARTVQKMHTIVENAKCKNVKSGVCYMYFIGSQNSRVLMVCVIIHVSCDCDLAGIGNHLPADRLVLFE